MNTASQPPTQRARRVPDLWGACPQQESDDEECAEDAGTVRSNGRPLVPPDRRASSPIHGEVELPDESITVNLRLLVSKAGGSGVALRYDFAT